jgi:single-stranded DNA-binding protein
MNMGTIPIIDDDNYVKIEGEITFIAPDNADGKAVNFIIGNRRKTRNGWKMFSYQIVAWDKVVNRLERPLSVGQWIRITGHLQESSKELEDGAVLKYQKVCADYIVFADD